MLVFSEPPHDLVRDFNNSRDGPSALLLVFVGSAAEADVLRDAVCSFETFDTLLAAEVGLVLLGSDPAKYIQFAGRGFLPGERLGTAVRVARLVKNGDELSPAMKRAHAEHIAEIIAADHLVSQSAYAKKFDLTENDFPCAVLLLRGMIDSTTIYFEEFSKEGLMTMLAALRGTFEKMRARDLPLRTVRDLRGIESELRRSDDLVRAREARVREAARKLAHRENLSPKERAQLEMDVVSSSFGDKVPAWMLRTSLKNQPLLEKISKLSSALEAGRPSIDPRKVNLELAEMINFNRVVLDALAADIEAKLKHTARARQSIRAGTLAAASDFNTVSDAAKNAGAIARLLSGIWF